LFDDNTLVSTWHHTVEEPDEATLSLLHARVENKGLTVAVSSVVPSAKEILLKGLSTEGVSTFEITHTSATMISDTYPSMGTDRVANAAAALKLYMNDNDAVIVIDFGTATTMTTVDKQGRFRGGLITLGLKKTLHSIHASLEQLPKLSPSAICDPLDLNVLATTTEDAIVNGTVIGHISMVSTWIAEGREQLGGKVSVVATGGLCEYFSRCFSLIDYIDPALTLKGINLIALAAAGREDLD
jgi:type III pantothenate kinase